MVWSWLFPLGLWGTRGWPAHAAPNRAALLRRIDRALESARRHHAGCVLLRLHLTGTQALRGVHGEKFANDALRVVEERLRRQVRAEDLIARTGEDEFTLLAQGVDGPLHSAGEAIAGRVMQSLIRPYGVDGMRFELGLRIGIAAFPGEVEGATGLLLRASQALHAARRMDRDGWRFALPGEPAALVASSG